MQTSKKQLLGIGLLVALVLATLFLVFIARRDGQKNILNKNSQFVQEQSIPYDCGTATPSEETQEIEFCTEKYDGSKIMWIERRKLTAQCKELDAFTSGCEANFKIFIKNKKTGEQKLVISHPYDGFLFKNWQGNSLILEDMPEASEGPTALSVYSEEGGKPVGSLPFDYLPYKNLAIYLDYSPSSPACIPGYFDSMFNNGKIMAMNLENNYTTTILEEPNTRYATPKLKETADGSGVELEVSSDKVLPDKEKCEVVVPGSEQKRVIVLPAKTN